MPTPLTVELLCREAVRFADVESSHREPALYGVTDGKAVGTYFEAKFRMYLSQRYDFTQGSAARVSIFLTSK